MRYGRHVLCEHAQEYLSSLDESIMLLSTHISRLKSPSSATDLFLSSIMSLMSRALHVLQTGLGAPASQAEALRQQTNALVNQLGQAGPAIHAAISPYCCVTRQLKQPNCRFAVRHLLPAMSNVRIA